MAKRSKKVTYCTRQIQKLLKFFAKFD